MRRAFMRAYPWDLAIEGVGDALDRMQGEVGLGGVSVWAACPPGAYPRLRGEPGVFRHPGGLLFATDPAGYELSRCKPVVSPWARDRDVLRTIADGAGGRGMALRLVVSFGNAPHLLRKHPECASKNAFGQESSERVCPLNPDARAFLAALVADVVARYGPDEVILCDVEPVWPEARMPSALGDAPLDPVARDLLSVCFCESCLQRAGAEREDASLIRRLVCESIVAMVRGGATPNGARGSPLDRLPAYRAGQFAAVQQWLAEIGERSGLPVMIDHGVMGPVGPACEGPTASGRNMIALAEDVSPDRWTVPRGCELRIPAGCAHGERGRALVGRLAELAAGGLSGVEFDHYAVFPDAALTVVKQAVRYARRSAQIV